jgi:hypothetical protein
MTSLAPRTCPYGGKGCAGEFTPKRATQLYCSPRCRYQHWVALHPRLAPAPKAAVKPAVAPKTWTGPRCFCGRPGRYTEKGVAVCGNHAFARRYAVEKRNRLVREILGCFSTEIIAARRSEIRATLFAASSRSHAVVLSTGEPVNFAPGASMAGEFAEYGEEKI